MKVVRIMLGIFGCLLVLFCGGCAVFLLVATRAQHAMDFIILYGFIPATVGALLAWWAFSRKSE